MNDFAQPPVARWERTLGPSVAYGFGVVVVLALALAAAVVSLRSPLTVARLGVVAPLAGPYPIVAPETAVVAEVLVAEGDSVVAGQPVLRLDDTKARVARDLAEAQLAEVMARRHRAEGEAAGQEFAANDPQGIGQDRVWRAREAADHAARAGIMAQLAALTAARAATAVQKDEAGLLVTLIQTRAARLADLAARGLATRDAVDLAAQDEIAARARVAALAAAQSVTEGQIAGLEAELDRLETDRRAAAATELADLVLAEADYRARRDAAADRLAALVLTAPASGIVTGIAGLTAGVILNGGNAQAAVLPTGGARIVRLMVSPTETATLSIGQPIQLRVAGRPDLPRARGALRRVAQHPMPDAGGRLMVAVEVDLPPEWPSLPFGAAVMADLPQAMAPLLPIGHARVAIVAPAEPR